MPDTAADELGAMPAPPALETLCDTFGLSRFERDVLLLCAGVELDAEIAAACGRAQGGASPAQPTFGLALAALPDAHWSALAPASPLRYWRMVELGSGSLTAAPLKIDERVLHCLVGVRYLDERLEGIVSAPLTSAELPASQEAVAEALAECWRRQVTPVWPLIALLGPDAAAKPAVAASACARLGLQLRMVPAEAIAASHVEQEALRRLWIREAMLDGAALLVECDSLEHAEAPQIASAIRFLEEVPSPVIVASSEPLRQLKRPTVRLEVGRPSAAEQRALWKLIVGAEAGRLNGALDQLTAQFDLGTRSIEAVRTQVGDSPAADGEDPGVRLWDACRTQMRPRLDDLAQRIEPIAGWDDLVLPELQLDLLREIAMHVRHRVHVYERWGFAAKSGRGLGISALFVGSSGTGKTMAAEVLARDLRLDLYRIDLSAVVSKYIGETEKNLRRVFDAAEEGGMILLFDEADALFGKRTEVKDSHDRYANIEVSYLLQRMEAYRGLAILTTNVRSALDTAFLRRLRFVVEFPFPTAEEREQIWRRIFPTETPTANLDHARLAQLSVPGGNIRNIALNAAFAAADGHEPVGMPHVLRAARSEYAKLEKPLTGTEIGGWS